MKITLQAMVIFNSVGADSISAHYNRAKIRYGVIIPNRAEMDSAPTVHHVNHVIMPFDTSTSSVTGAQGPVGVQTCPRLPPLIIYTDVSEFVFCGHYHLEAVRFACILVSAVKKRHFGAVAEAFPDLVFETREGGVCVHQG